MSSRSELRKIVARIARELPPSTVQSIVSELRNDADSKLCGRLSKLGKATRSKNLLAECDCAWGSTLELDASALAFALEVAVAQAQTGDEQVDIELIWTGPTTSTVPLRRTEQTLCELIESAREELLIVSFIVYKADQVMSALCRAQERGVRTKLVLETSSDNGGKVSFDQLSSIQETLPGASIYVWPVEKRLRDELDRYGSIHAKCAVADGARALIGSANLTGFALALNMEMGALIHGSQLSQQIANHFDELIRREILTPVIGK